MGPAVAAAGEPATHRLLVVAVAVARELAGFCWSLAVMND
jgi:hypothetical protein